MNTATFAQRIDQHLDSVAKPLPVEFAHFRVNAIKLANALQLTPIPQSARTTALESLIAIAEQISGEFVARQQPA
jgi:hypothetical protein